MAIAATTVFEVRNGGSDTQCSGGFNVARGGTDYTLQNAAQATGTVTVATTTCTATTGIFTSQMVGNTITDGTSIREITAFTSSTIVTLDATVAWTATTIYVGGALASPGKAGAYATVAGVQVAVKYNATPYSITSASTNIAGGCVSAATNTCWFGYDTTRSPYNTDANRPTLLAGAISTANLLSGGSVSTVLSNFITDANSVASTRGVQNVGVIWRCKAINCTSGGVSTGHAFFCSATGCSGSGGGFSVCASATYCESYNNSITGFQSVVVAIHCVSYGNTGVNSLGFTNCVRAEGCVAYNNTSDGFANSANTTVQLSTNCIAEANGGFGWNSLNTSSRQILYNCASYNNSGGRLNTATLPTIDTSPITGSGSFFTNAAGGVFTLNNTAGAGALCRATGFPALFPAGLTANYADVGAAQSQAAAGGAILYNPSLDGM